MNIFEARPDGQTRGAVIVVQEAFGVNDHIQDVCKRLAAEGYLAVAPHLFHRTGDPVIPYAEGAQTVEHLKGLTSEGLTADLEATFSYLAGAGFQPSQVGMIGFCMGGSVALLAAASREFGGAVTFYGGGIAQGRFGIPPLADLAGDLKTPWLGLYGDLDQSIPVDQVEALEKAVKAAPVTTEIVRYPEGGHGFHCDARGSYHEKSAKDAWQRALRWLGSGLATG